VSLLKKKIEKMKGEFKKVETPAPKLIEEKEETIEKLKEEVKELEEKKIDEESKEEKIVQVPIFLTPADVNRLIYENNIILKKLISEE